MPAWRWCSGTVVVPCRPRALPIAVSSGSATMTKPTCASTAVPTRLDRARPTIAAGTPPPG